MGIRLIIIDRQMNRVEAEFFSDNPIIYLDAFDFAYVNFKSSEYIWKIEVLE